MNKRANGYLIKLTLVATLGGLLFGYDTASSNFSKYAARTLIGATNPTEAAVGTIRNEFADSISENAVHGSDSDENAKIESDFHFSGREVY